MKTLISIFISLLVSAGFAHHFTGSYQNQQQGISVAIQHNSNGQMQGSFQMQGQQLSLQGQGNQQGASGLLMGPQLQLGFQAQISPDLAVLQMVIMPFTAQNQPDQSRAQQLILQRVTPAGSGTGAFPPPAGSGTGNGGGFPAPTNPGPGFAPPGPSDVGTLGNGAGGLPPIAGSQGNAPSFGQVPGSTAGFPPTAPNTQRNPPAGWAGSYSDGRLTLNLQGGNGSYQGMVQVGGAQYPLQARGDDYFLEGVIQNGNQPLPFVLKRMGNGGMVLLTEAAEYWLQPSGFAPNPNPLGN